MTVALLSALPQEVALLTDAMEIEETSSPGGFAIAAGTLDRVRVVIATAGIGKVNAATATTLLVDRYRTDTVVFTGVAGGLDPTFGIGDVVIGDPLIQHDTGLIARDRLSRYQAGHVVFFNPTDEYGYRLDDDLRGRITRRLEGFELAPLDPEAGGRSTPPRIEFGTILTGDQYVQCEATRRRLQTDLGGVAVEMEGAAVAQTAERLGARHVVIRALSDLAGADSSIDFRRFLTQVSSNSAAVVRRLLPVL